MRVYRIHFVYGPGQVFDRLALLTERQVEQVRNWIADNPLSSDILIESQDLLDIDALGPAIAKTAGEI